MALALPVQWPRLGHMGPGRRHHVARQCSNQSWRVQAATLGGTLVSLLKALRQAGVAERRRRLREATTAQLRIISAGLRLRAPVTPVGQGSRAALMARIEEALAQDARLAAPDQPIGRILRSFPTDKTDQFEQLMIDRLSCAKLKGRPSALLLGLGIASCPQLCSTCQAFAGPCASALPAGRLGHWACVSYCTALRS